MECRSRRVVYDKVSLSCNDESLTHQSFKDVCNVNNILKKYEKTGLVSQSRSHQQAKN